MIHVISQLFFRSEKRRWIIFKIGQLMIKQVAKKWECGYL